MTKTESAQQKIDQFKSRFGAGHYAFACQAAFPIGFTPDLLYQLWANFKEVPDENEGKLQIELIAVSDLLLSPLCIQTGRDIFEMDITVRALLLEELWKDRFQKINRMEEIAFFIFQYLDSKTSEIQYESLRETLYWNTLVTIEPDKAFGQVLRRLTDSIKNNNEGEIFRFRNLLESFAYQDKGLQQAGKSRFYSLMNYTKAMKASLLSYPPELIEEQLKQSGAWVFTTDPQKAQTSVKLPLLEKMVGTLEPTQPDAEAPAELKIQLKEIFVILIGIDNYPAPIPQLSGCVNDVNAYEDYLHNRYHSDAEWDLYIDKLANAEATEENVRELIERTLQRAGPEDFVFIAFSGHSQVYPSYGNQLIFYDSSTGSEYSESNPPFPLSELLAANPETSIILAIDSVRSAGILPNPPKNVVFLAAATAEEHSYEIDIDGKKRGVFSYQLIQALREAREPLTYRQLMEEVANRITGRFQQTPTLLCAAGNQDKHPFVESLAEGHEELQVDIWEWDKKLTRLMAEAMRPYHPMIESLLEQEQNGKEMEELDLRVAILDQLPLPVADELGILFSNEKEPQEIPPSKPQVFISYQRADTASATTRLSNFLELKLGKGAVLKDMDIPVKGGDSLDTVRQAINSVEIVLAMIGENFAPGQGGPNDYYTFEISYAFQQNKKIIPVFIDNAVIPSYANLPESIQPLTRIQGIQLRNSHWQSDSTVFLKELNDLLGQASEVVPLQKLKQLLNVYEILVRYINYILLSELWNFLYQIGRRNFPAVIGKAFRQAFSRDAQSPDKVALLRTLAEMVNQSFAQEKYEPFIREIGEFCRQLLLDKEVYDAFDQMERLLPLILADNSKIDPGNKLEDELLDYFGTIFTNISFLTNYELVSIRDIYVRKNWHREASFEHQLIRLHWQRFDGVEPTLYTGILDSNSILLLKSRRDVDAYLNLSPFIIDEHTFTDKDRARLLFLTLLERPQETVYINPREPEDSISLAQKIGEEQRFSEVEQQIAQFFKLLTEIQRKK